MAPVKPVPVSVTMVPPLVSAVFGLTAVTVAVLFLLSLFLSPLAAAIPAYATAPALVPDLPSAGAKRTHLPRWRYQTV